MNTNYIVVATIRNEKNINEIKGYIICNPDTLSSDIKTVQADKINDFLDLSKLSYDITKLPREIGGYLCGTSDKVLALKSSSVKVKVATYKNSEIKINWLEQTEFLELARKGKVYNQLILANEDAQKEQEYNNKLIKDSGPITIEEFEDYMKSKGYKYSLSNGILSNVDARCRILRVPEGVHTLTDLIDSAEFELDELFIPETVNIISKMTTSEQGFGTIKKIVFENGNENSDEKVEEQQTLYGTGLVFINVEEIKLPLNRKIIGAFNYCILPSEIVLPLRMGDAKDSFNNCKGLQYIKETGFRANRKVTLSNCFNNLEIDKLTIKNSGINLGECFCNSKIKEIDIVNTNENDKYSFCAIFESFNNISDLTKLYIRLGKHNVHLEKSFNDCNSLAVLDIKKSLITLREGFSNTALKSVRLDNGVGKIKFPIFNDDTTITFEETFNDIHSYRICTLKDTISNPLIMLSKDIRLGGALMHLFETEDGKPDLERFSWLANVIELQGGEGIYGFSKTTIFDSNYFPKVQEYNNILTGSQIKTCILRDNIKTISDNAFMNNHKLREIILNNKIDKIPKNLFKNVNSGVISVYIPSDSPIYDSLKKEYSRNIKVQIIPVNSIDDAILEVVPNELNNTKKAKFQLMLNGGKYEEILENEYINNADYIYKILRTIELNKPVEPRPVLNRTKFRSISLDNMPGLKKLVNKNESTITEIDDRFVNLTNFITTFWNNEIMLYKEHAIEVLEKSIESGDCNISIFNPNSLYKIALVNYTIENTNQTFSLMIAYVCIGNEIVFMTAIHSYLPYILSYLSHRLNSLNSEYNVSIAHELQTSDSPSKGIIHGVKFPSMMKDNVKPIKTYNWLTLGYIVGTTNFKKTTLKVLVYDIVDGMFIEGTTEIDSKNKDEEYKKVITEISLDHVVKTYTLAEVNNINKRYLEQVIKGTDKESVEYLGTQNKLKIISESDDEKNQYYNKPNSYDLSINKKLMRLSHLIYEKGIQRLADLDEETIELILNSEWFKPADITLKKVKADNSKYTIQTSLELGIDTVYVEWQDVSEAVVYAGIIRANSKLNSKKVIFESHTYMKMLIESLYNLGEYVHFNKINENAVPEFVTNNPINLDDFEIIKNVLDNTYVQKQKVRIGIHKSTHNVYLIVSNDKYDFKIKKAYILFRFKNLKDCVEYYCNNTRELSDRYLLFDVIDAFQIETDKYIINELMQLREDIISGMPNGYPYIFSDVTLCDKLAKQPKKL